MKNLKGTVLITGAAGFIGSALTIKFLNEGYKVVGIDNLNNYYDKALKLKRIERIEDTAKSKNNWEFVFGSIENNKFIRNVFKKYFPDIVVNLAAQAGVRHSINNPASYVKSNLVGFHNILDASVCNKVKHLVFASSSSVYGGNKKIPFTENDSVDHPVSFYAATKKSNEIIAHSYSHLYNLPITGLRYFTVYGPWGRPDMAPMIFTKSILGGEIIKVFNYGKMERDFTFIDDIVEGTYKCCLKPATSDEHFFKKKPDPSLSFAPYRIFNIGNTNKIPLLYFISLLEDELGIKAKKKLLPIQPGDVEKTQSDLNKIDSWIGYKPKINFKDGIKKFIDWYISFYGYN